MSAALEPGSTSVPPREREHRTHLAWVPIAEVMAQRDQLVEQSCSEAERDELSGRHVQTLAGLLALKTAVAELLATLEPEAELALRDIELGHAPDGAPTVVRLPVALPVDSEGHVARLWISITHTKAHAIGVAVLEQRVAAR